jgi:hypothetical protein
MSGDLDSSEGTGSPLRQAQSRKRNAQSQSVHWARTYSTHRKMLDGWGTGAPADTIEVLLERDGKAVASQNLRILRCGQDDSRKLTAARRTVGKISRTDDGVVAGLTAFIPPFAKARRMGTPGVGAGEGEQITATTNGGVLLVDLDALGSWGWWELGARGGAGEVEFFGGHVGGNVGE